MNPSSAIFRPTPTRAVKMVSFHTFVFDGPIFQSPIPIRTEKSSPRCFVFCDLLPKWRSTKMNVEISQKENLLYRTLLALVLIALVAALRIAPHPWNFTPVGAMALFAGANTQKPPPRLPFPAPCIVRGGYLHRLSQINPHRLRQLPHQCRHRSVAPRRPHRRPHQPCTLLGAIQFFFITNFAVWQFLGGYPHTATGLLACYIAGIPFSGTLWPATPCMPPCFSAASLCRTLPPRVSRTCPGRPA